MSKLFSSGASGVEGEHYAMLDGRRVSFACSTVEPSAITPKKSQNWRWSADLAHHILITDKEVQLRSGREPVVRTFQRDSVETRLDEFIQFLDNSRISALPDVVSFLIEEFRQIWAASMESAGQDALAVFLIAMFAAGETDPDIISDPNWRRSVASEIGLDNSALKDLSDAAFNRARGMKNRTPLDLQLVPSLILRHAAGRLFQEAHAVLEWVQHSLFGNASISVTPTYSPEGAYFTPVPIARLLAEWALRRWDVFPDELTIADFACGSAVFLTEALHTLERRGFNGRVRVIGRDKSAQAVMMAKVSVRTAARDISSIRIIPDISQADALDVSWPKADVVLMNPPFRSWENMSSREREWVRQITNDVGHGRPDLSVGFIERAIRALTDSGVLATLVPAGVLASDGLSKWRNGLLRKVNPTLIAVLGEHGLFQHALVNVGVLALQNSSNMIAAPKPSLYVAWSSAESGAASRAIRAIRRSTYLLDEIPRDHVDGWSVTVTDIDAWRQRPSWLPGAGMLGSILQKVQTNTATKVSDLFDVRQGIRTGANDVFIQPRHIVQKLPQLERRYFKEAVDTSSFMDGEIKPQNYLFIADDAWRTEVDVRRKIPNFFDSYLRVAKASLLKRKSLKDTRWWRLTRPRGWSSDAGPQLLSKRFGLYPAFARDLEGRFAVVQANAWKPTQNLGPTQANDELCDLLTAYWWLLNSRLAVALFREFCPNVAGGQLDLEHKYVRHVPMPNLGQQFEESPTLQILATSIRTRYADSLPPLSERDHFAAAAFGTDVGEWNLFGLEPAD